jgi:hypothetical protein
MAYVALKLNRSVRYIENLLAMPDLPANFKNFACRNPSVYGPRRRLAMMQQEPYPLAMTPLGRTEADKLRRDDGDGRFQPGCRF